CSPPAAATRRPATSSRRPARRSPGASLRVTPVCAASTLRDRLPVRLAGETAGGLHFRGDGRMKVGVGGSGYVGRVSGACLAVVRMSVRGVDKDAAKIAALERGEIPIYEPGLEEIVAKNVRSGRLRFATDLAPAIREARAVFIAVGTPPLPDGRADLSFVRQVAEAIGDDLNDYKVVITKSTVPVGTGQMVESVVRERSGGRQEFAVVSNPEFLREGSAIEDFMQPDRVVIGARTERAVQVMLDIYAPLKAAGVPFVVADVESAEMIKYAS